MTVNNVSAITYNDSIYDTTKEQTPFKEGEIINGTVVDLRDTTISIRNETNQKTFDIELDRKLDVEINDRVQVEVLKASENILKLSIKKIDKTIKEMESHNPSVDSVNFDKIKRVIVETNNPLQHSTQLNKHIEHTISQVNEMLETFTDKDIEAIIREGFDLTKMTVDLLYQVGHSNRIDKKIALTNDEKPKMEISVDDKKIDELINEFSSKHLLSAIPRDELELVVHELVNKDVPVNTKNVEKVIYFSEKVDKVKEMKAEDIVKFLSSNKDRTVKELYKSLFVSTNRSQKDVVSEAEYKLIEDSVEAIINKAFFESNDNQTKLKFNKTEMMEIAKALVLKGVPLDERAIESIEYISTKQDKKEVIDIAISQLQKQLKPEEYHITTKIESLEIPSKDNLIELTRLVKQSKPEHVEKVVLSGKPLTFQEIELQMETETVKIETVKTETIKTETGKILGNEKKSIVITPENKIEIDEGNKDLQIIRYQLTYKAAMRLSIEGVNLKTENLSIIRARLETFDIQYVDETKPIVKAENKTSNENTVDENKVNSKVNESKVNENIERELSKHEKAVLEVKRHMAIISSASLKSIALVATNNSEKTIRNISESITAENRTTDNDKIADNEIAVSEIEKNEDVKEQKIYIDTNKKVNRGQLAAMRYDELRTEVRRDLGDTIEKAFANIDELLDDLNLESTVYNHRAVEILARNEMPITLENINMIKELDVSLQELFNKMMPEHVKELVDKQINVVNEPIENLVEFVRMKEAEIKQEISEEVAKQIIQMTKAGSLSQEQKETLIGIYRMIHTIEASKGAAVGFIIENNLPVTLETLFDVAKVIGTSKGAKPFFETKIDDEFGKLDKLIMNEPTIKEQIQKGYIEKEGEIDKIIDENLRMDNKDKIKEQINEIKKLLQNMVNLDVNQLKEALAMDKLSLKDFKTFQQLDEQIPEFKQLMSVLEDAVEGNLEFKDSLRSIVNNYVDNPTRDGLENFEREMKQLLNQVKNESMREFFDKQHEFASQLEQHVKGLETSDNRTLFDLSRDINSHMNLQKSLIDQEDYYTVPVLINGEMHQMNMYYFRQNKQSEESNEEMSIYFSFTTNNIGTANIKVQLKDDESTIVMYATKDAGNRQMKGYEDEFRELFVNIGIEAKVISYEKFIFPKPINKDQKIAQSNKVKKYNSDFEKMV